MNQQTSITLLAAVSHTGRGFLQFFMAMRSQDILWRKQNGMFLNRALVYMVAIILAAITHDMHLLPCTACYFWGIWYLKQVSQAVISNCSSHNSVRYNYLSQPETTFWHQSPLITVHPRDYGHGSNFVRIWWGWVLARFNHILQGYIPSIRTIIWCCWSNPKSYGSITWHMSN